MNTKETTIFSLELLSDEIIRGLLEDICQALKERGYDPINQLVGYLVSGDLGYISSYKDSRKKISRIERHHIVEFLLKSYLKD